MPDLFSNGSKYVTDAGVVALECDWQLMSAMRTLIGLVRDGIAPDCVTWFYYDHDWSRDADEGHTFFAIHDGKVILESCHFSSEAPLVIKRELDDDPVWHSHPYFHKAVERYWYRKFYTETMTGQLMVLRPDEPTLYHYERPQSRDVVRDLQVVTLVKTYRLLWVAVPLLGAIAFPSLKNFMGIVAVLLLIDVLWRCWATRKVGQDD